MHPWLFCILGLITRVHHRVQDIIRSLFVLMSLSSHDPSCVGFGTCEQCGHYAHLVVNLGREGMRFTDVLHNFQLWSWFCGLHTLSFIFFLAVKFLSGLQYIA